MILLPALTFLAGAFLALTLQAWFRASASEKRARQPRASAPWLATVPPSEWRRLFNNLDEAVALARPDGTILHCNEAFRRLAAAEAERGRINLPDANWRASREESDTQWVLGAPKAQPNDAVYEKLTDANGQVAAICCVRRDRSEVRSVRERLVHARRSQEQAMLARSVCHDFGNFLMPILIFSEAIQKAAPPMSEVYQHASNIIEGARRLSRLVKQIQTFSQGRDYSVEQVDVAEIIEDVCRIARRMAPRRVAIRREVPNNCPRLTVSPIQILQVLSNLAVNAIHAVEKRGDRVAISARVETSDKWAADPDLAGKFPSKARSCLVLSVRDNGPGMDAEVLAKIGKPFFSTKPPEKGTGLGVSTVRKIVQLYHGALRYRSKPGEGTTAEAWFPLEVGGQEAAAKSREPHLDLLLLGRDPEKLRALKTELERDAFVVHPFVDSECALEALSNSPQRFDAIVAEYSEQAGNDGLGEAIFGLWQGIRRIRMDIPVFLRYANQSPGRDVAPTDPFTQVVDDEVDAGDLAVALRAEVGRARVMSASWSRTTA